MCKNFIKSKVAAGFLQSFTVVVYILLVASFIRFAERFSFSDQTANIVFTLSLLVFSAAVCGSIIFGYPVFLALSKKPKDALQVLGYTLLFLFMFVILVFSFLLFYL